MRSIFCLALLTALLAGCTALLPPRTEGDDVVELLDRFHRLSPLSVDEQRKEQVTAQADFEQEAGEVQRLRLALALSLPRAPWRDDARVVALLAPLEVAAGERPSPRRDLANLLARLAEERLRLAKEDQRLTKEEQRLTKEEQRLTKEDQRRYETALREEQRKVQELQQKLEALRSIDRDMRSRSPARPRP